MNATPTLLDAVEALLRIHDEPAGFVGKYGKELDKAIRAQQAKVDAAVALARAALAAHPTQPAVQTKVEISADPELLSRAMRAETELALWKAAQPARVPAPDAIARIADEAGIRAVHGRGGANELLQQFATLVLAGVKGAAS